MTLGIGNIDQKLLKLPTTLKLRKSLIFAVLSRLPTSEITKKKAQKNESLNCNLLKFLNRYGIFWVPPGESSCQDGSEHVWQRGGRESLRPSYGRPKLTLISSEKKYLRRCSKNLRGHNFDFRTKSS